jgi:hypothetical protein
MGELVADAFCLKRPDRCPARICPGCIMLVMVSAGKESESKGLPLSSIRLLRSSTTVKGR